MGKKLRAAVAVGTGALALNFAGCFSDDAAKTSSIKGAEGSTMRVVGIGCGQIAYGSAFIYAPNHLVTTAEAVAGKKEFTVDNYWNGREDAKVVYFNPKQDLAVLYAPGVSAPVPLAGQTPSVGEKVTLIGYPGGSYQATLQLKVTAVESDANSKWLDIGYGLPQGVEGGPLVNSRGQAVGVLAPRHAGEPARGAQDIQQLRGKLDAAKNLTDSVSTNPPCLGRQERPVRPARDWDRASVTEAGWR